MIKKFILLFIGILFGTVYCHSQFLIIKGTVTDSSTHEPIEGASIRVDFQKSNQGTVTDKEGKFVLTLQPGEHAISIRHIGFVPLWFYTNNDTKSTSIEILLKKVAYELEQVVVTSKGFDKTVKKPLLGVNQINLKTIQRMPAAFGEVDFLRALQMLPGVSSVGEASNGVNIRGGTTDQNLILLDDTPIFNPTHMFGMFSVIPPDGLSSLELYKGNVPARYGGRTAAVLDISLKNPNLEKFKVTGGVSLISNKLMLEVPIVKNKLGIYISGRASYSDFLLPIASQAFDSVKTNFSELVGKLFWRVNQKNTFTTVGYFSNDFFQTNLLANLPNVIGTTTFFEHNTLNFNAKWVYLINKNIDLLSSYTQANYDPTIGTIESKNKNRVRLLSGIYQKQAKTNLNVVREHQKIELGLSYTKYEINPGEINPGNSISVNAIKTNPEFSREMAAYVDDEYSISKKVAATVGLRYSYFTALGPGTVRQYDPSQTRDDYSVISQSDFEKNEKIKSFGGLEPRLGIRYSANESLTFKLGYNLMRQYLQIVSNTTTPIPTSRWKTSDANIAPQVSQLLSLGAYKTSPNNIYEISAEVYYRASKNIIDYKPGANFLLQQYPETQLIQGQSKSYGLELMLAKKKGKFTGWTNYTYARTFNKVNIGTNALDVVNFGNWYRANFDRPHSFNTSVDIAVDKHNSFDFNLVISSGRPFTQPIGFVTYQNNYYPFYDERNNKRIPTYHRLDFSWNISNPSMKDRRWTGNWAFSVYNLYGAKNTYSIFFKTENNNAKAYRLKIFGAPIMSIAYNFVFK